LAFRPSRCCFQCSVLLTRCVTFNSAQPLPARTGRNRSQSEELQNRNELQTDRVLAGLVMVTAIGLLVEGLIFRTLERLTVRRWGMLRCDPYHAR